jgi:hypothetical protein
VSSGRAAPWPSWFQLGSSPSPPTRHSWRWPPVTPALEAVSLLGAYFVCGDLDALKRLVEMAGLRVAAIQTHVGTVRCASIDEFVATEVESTPLGERISAEAHARILEGAREVLRPFTKPDGTAEIPLEGHVVAARKLAAGG